MTDKITFIHLPKTGGTTITTYLDDLFDLDRICPIHDQIVLEKNAATLTHYKLFRGHFMLSRLPPVARDDCRLLTVLRDPVRRILSSFQHWLRDPALYHSFPRSPLLHNHNIQTMALSPLGLKSYATLRDHLEAAKHALDEFFFVGIQEELDAGCLALFRLLNRPGPTQVRRTNAGDYNNDVPDALIDELTQSNWADVELYQHAVKTFRQRGLPPLESDAATAWPLLPPLSARDSLHYRMNQALIGHGWHPREGLGPADPQCWRWTGPETESHLVVPLCPRVPYHLSVRVLNAVSTEVLNSMRVSIDGCPIPLERVHAPWYRRRRSAPGGWLYRGYVPEDRVSSHTTGPRITFQVEKTIPRSHADPGSTSNMLCGLAISEINFEPV